MARDGRAPYPLPARMSFIVEAREWQVHAPAIPTHRLERNPTIPDPSHRSRPARRRRYTGGRYRRGYRREIPERDTGEGYGYRSGITVWDTGGGYRRGIAEGEKQPSL